MSTIIITPLGTTETETSEVVQLELVVNDEDFVGLFDRLEVWRSITDAAGPYEELTTSPAFKPARIPKAASDPPVPAVTGASVFIVGELLTFKVNESIDVPIVFTGSDPLDFSTIAGQIISQGLGLVSSYVDSTGLLVVQTITTGVGTSLRIVDQGNAAAILSLPTTEPDSLAFGKNARISLLTGQQTYSFVDPFSSSTYFYKTRFSNSATGAVSEFSIPFSVGQAIGITQDNIACGTVELVSIDGKPLQDLEVRIFAQFNGSIVDAKTVAGGDLVKSTDENGKVEFSLVRGQKLTVAIMGTDLTREIIVPTDTSIKTFNLLDPSIVTGDDVFKVQIPDIVFAERRSL